jgi:hypothetical protein
MPAAGTTFTDWEQVEADRRRPLLVDEDFSWSEPPSRRRRSVASEPKVESRRHAEYDDESEPAFAPRASYETESTYSAQESYETESTYAAAGPADRKRSSDAAEPLSASGPASGADAIDVERELDIAWGGRLSASAADTYEVVPYSFAGEAAFEPSGRRTVVITGRGAANYSVSRRRAEAGLAFHERSGFNPDRVAMWAVLLGIALLLGCIAH